MFKFQKDHLTTSGVTERVLVLTGLTQQELAEVIGVAQPSISRWVAGGQMTSVYKTLMDSIYSAQWNDDRRLWLRQYVETGKFGKALMMAIGHKGDAS